MRPSSRTAILDAAFRLADHDDGALAVTFDAVAKEAGVTKGGVLYHFPTRNELIIAVTAYAAQRVVDAMAELLGAPLEQATPEHRIRAYITVVGRGRLTRADLAIFTESLSDPALAEPWESVLGPWISVDGIDDPVRRARLSTARLAADGLWMADATEVLLPHPDDRDRILDHIRSLTDDLA
ncbi:TetR family transcriptional regulator [Nakamurella sp. YIM 132087]|uniref:TetR family transcriptional regulator n=1 Tax=Nakamurella alba TaxID=2665158 RepID=A0A7K1FFK6_9ACTN|nr:TetR/AcrR family transcriptional regulator [Nakamurella alba]MTD12901.1 TetR family transcriptional regulator [Nakamurella alba]